jgi:hypothetical protein
MGKSFALPCITVVIAVLVTGPLSAETPTVTRAVPSAVAPGRTVELTLHGSGLDSATALWTSIAAEAKFVGGAGDHAICRLTLAPEAQAGVAALRVAARGGVSNLHLFMVDDLPTVAEQGGNSTPAGAQEIAPPVAVDGACEALGFDYYKFHAKRGQRLSVEVVATRLGSPLDPVVRLLDSAGRELRWCDDGPGAGGDCRFVHTFDAEGQYLIELRDVSYDGGPAYRYRLRVGDFPLAAVPFPLGGKRGTTGMFSLLGEACEGVPPALVALPQDGKRFGLSARRPGTAGGCGFARVVVGDLDETTEAEPNDTPDAATPLALPGAVNGRFETPGDVDCYAVAARTGDRLTFRARSRSLGSPCDVTMQWSRKGGGKLAESKVAEGTAEASLDATAPEDGTYVLRIEELSRAGGPALAYRIEGEPYRAGFALSVEADKFDAKPGGEIEVKVTCVRRDYAGPISLSVEGLKTVGLDGATIAAGKADTPLKVKLPSDLSPGAIVHFKIIGTATVGAAEVRSVASTVPALKKLFPRMLYPPEELDGLLALGVREP